MDRLEQKLARARFLDRNRPSQGRATFGPADPGIPDPADAKPFVEPTPSEVCCMKLAVARKVADIREADRAEAERLSRLGIKPSRREDA